MIYGCVKTNKYIFIFLGKTVLGLKVLYLHGADHGAQGEHGGGIPERGLAVKCSLRVHQQHGHLSPEKPTRQCEHGFFHY